MLHILIIQTTVEKYTYGVAEDPRALMMDKVAKDSGRDAGTYINDSGYGIDIWPFPEHLVKKFIHEVVDIHTLLDKAHEFMENEFWCWAIFAQPEDKEVAHIEVAALMVAGLRLFTKDIFEHND